MVHVYRCIRESRAPWSIGDHIAYAPFDIVECVTVVTASLRADKFGTDMIPAVHRDVFSGALEHICDRVDDEDVRILLASGYTGP
jgi:hypothetical protein